ncbi:MAG: hypothetical protein RIQ57_67, partial [Pseudomonadota bacterium]
KDPSDPVLKSIDEILALLDKQQKEIDSLKHK